MQSHFYGNFAVFATKLVVRLIIIAGLPIDLIKNQNQPMTFSQKQ